MTWFIWILISVITTAAANLLQRVVMREKDSDPYGTTVIFQLTTTLMTGIFAFSQGFQMPPIGAHLWNFVLSAFFWGFGSYSLFKAFQSLGSSENAIISSLGTIVTIITAVFFLGESFNTPKIIGTALILGSIIALNFKNGKFTFGVGTKYAVISTVLFGLGVTNDAFILRTYDAVSYTPIAFLLPTILLLIIRPKAVSSFHRLANYSFRKNMFLLAFFYSAQAITYYLALQIGPSASQIATINKSNIIVTVLLAMIFLKERESLGLKFLSAILVTVGVLLIK